MSSYYPDDTVTTDVATHGVQNITTLIKRFDTFWCVEVNAYGDGGVKTTALKLFVKTEEDLAKVIDGFSTISFNSVDYRTSK